MARKRQPNEQHLIRHVGTLFEDVLKTKGLTRTAAARMYRQPESYITNVIRGRNLTLRTLVKTFDIVGADVEIKVRVRG